MATRNKKKRTPHSQNDRWVVVAADSAVEAPQKDDSDPTFVRLRNPSTHAVSLYLLGSGDVQLYEVKAFNEDFHFWFIGQTVQRDGRLLYVTPMDPLYLLLPYLFKAGKEVKFQPVYQMLMDEDFPACTRLLICTHSLASLHHMAEEKEVGSQKFHRYSQERTMEWLKKKAERTVKALGKTNISVGERVKSTTYVRVKKESETQEEDYLQIEDYLQYAHGLISAYIREDLSKALLNHLQLPELSSPNEKRKLSDTPVEVGEGYTKFNSSDFTRKPPKKMSTAQRTLGKVDKTGMKSMSAFFSPKGQAEKN
ncbi:unnamed protein product [Coregonus sp. 'balchen']|nr:unnamed protein product [Coregonus sp. 'balchen']